MRKSWPRRLRRSCENHVNGKKHCTEVTEATEGGLGLVGQKSSVKP
jgi:hypothetical protein